MEWYQNHYRRNLVDMHIEDWNPEFLSAFDPAEYVENLKRANINAPMLYLQSHIGLCYWPTKSGWMHSALKGREDMIRQVEQLCHKNGMSVIAYYSLIYNNRAHEQHPDWRMVDLAGRNSRSGGNRYGLCCPNNPGYRAFLEQQISEFCSYFQFEGIFYDMLFWSTVCTCPCCRARWEKEVGGELPLSVDWKDARWRLLQKKRCEWMGEFALWVSEVTHRYKPGVSIEHQYSTMMVPWLQGVNENMAIASTYSGGDLYGGLEEQSFACKLYYGCTNHQPFEYMTSRAYPSLAEHTTTKSVDMIRQSVMLTYAHHGASLMIDAIDPVGTMDREVYERIGQVYREAEPYEKVLQIGEQVMDVALYYDMNGKFDPEDAPTEIDGPFHTQTPPMLHANLGAARSLRAHHIPYGVVNSAFFDRFQQAKVLALCDPADFEDSKVDAVLDYVRNGGSLYLSGHCAPRLLKEIFNLSYVGRTEETVTYLSPTEAGRVYMDGCFTAKHPLAMSESQLLAQGDPYGTVLATLTLPYTIPRPGSGSVVPFYQTVGEQDDDPRKQRFASIHSNPPGVYTDQPALVVTDYGKGKAVWSAAPIERPDREQHSEVFARLIAMLAGEKFSFAAKAPEYVECILFDDPAKKCKVMSVINLFEAFHVPEINKLSVSIRCEKKPKAVHTVVQNEPLPFTWEKQICTVEIDQLKCCTMFTVDTE